tara:strand:- start:480 stop:1286 length:807 start_codon:yes stop_codon:yes gene_type:complete
LHRVHLASDLHLGAPDAVLSRKRELHFVGWLEDSAAGNNHADEGPATEIHLVGDTFDFWHEYKHAVPKGGTRLLGAIARVVDSGIPMHYHTGNHDLWTYGYLEQELGVQLHRDPIIRNYDGLNCMIGHGDGLGPGDYGYKRIKKVFTSPLLQWAFRWIHPDCGIPVANYLSRNSRARGGKEEIIFQSPEDEWLWLYSKEVLKTQDIDCFIFGHRHMPLDLEIPRPLTSSKSNPARYINLGDWIQYFTCGKVINGQASLLYHQKPHTSL